MGKQIKITLSEKLHKIIVAKAKKIGIKPSTYCFNVVFSDIKKEIEKNE